MDFKILLETFVSILGLTFLLYFFTFLKTKISKEKDYNDGSKDLKGKENETLIDTTKISQEWENQKTDPSYVAKAKDSQTCGKYKNKE